MQIAPKKPCPNCSGLEIYRSHRRTAFERYLLRAIGMRAYRCIKCDSRFYGFSHSYEDASPDVRAA
jgi:hypothetical protein